VQVDWLERLVSEMTYNLLMGMLNPLQSLYWLRNILKMKLVSGIRGWWEAWQAFPRWSGAVRGQIQSLKTPGELGVSKSMECDIFPFIALTLLVWWQEGHPVCKKLVVGLSVVTIWLELCTQLIAPVFNCHRHSIVLSFTILSFNKYRLTWVHLENVR